MFAEADLGCEVFIRVWDKYYNLALYERAKAANNRGEAGCGMKQDICVEVDAVDRNWNTFHDLFSEMMGKGRNMEFGEDAKVKKAYQSSSGIDIDHQREIWDERAKGYWGEYKVFSLLFHELDFPNKILVNVQIPTEQARSTEIDLMLFAPSGVYVFEIKHYSGKVYGGYDSATWTEYYKTRESVTFENPLKQNAYHMSQLSRLLPGIKLFSYVVFTNSSAEIKVGGRYPGNMTVTCIESLVEKIRCDFASREAVYLPEQIEELFKRCSVYSPLESDKNEYFVKEGELLPFSGFAEQILYDIKAEKVRVRERIEQDLKERSEILKKRENEVAKLESEYRGLVDQAEAERNRAIRSLEEFEKNFETVTPYMYESICLNRESLKANVKFKTSDSFVNTTNMFFEFSNVSSELWMNTSKAWFIVGLKNGKVKKYKLVDHVVDYSHRAGIAPNTPFRNHLVMMRLFNVPEESIRFIKLCNVFISKEQYGRKNIGENIEFEVYVAEDCDSVYSEDTVVPSDELKNVFFEISPDFLVANVSIESSADGDGSDIWFDLSANTSEAGFDMRSAAFVIGTKSGTVSEYGLAKNTRSFYSTTVMPQQKSNKYVMHLKEIQSDDIDFIQLKGLRIFRVEHWQTDHLLPGAVFDLQWK